MPFGTAKFRGQKCLHQIPSQFRARYPATKAKQIKVVILDPLFRRKMIFNQTGPGAFDFIGANTGSHPAAADSYATFHFAGRHGARQWNNEIRIIIVMCHFMRAEVGELMTGGTKPLKQ